MIYRFLFVFFGLVFLVNLQALAQSEVIRERLAYLFSLEDVSWMQVNNNDIHIGFRNSPTLNIDILKGAVGSTIGVLGGKNVVRAFGYEAGKFSSPGKNGEGATCKVEGKIRVERTRCLRGGIWVKPSGARR